MAARVHSNVLLVLTLCLACRGETSLAQDDLQTVAEASEFKATSTSAEVAAFMESCAARSRHVSVTQFGSTVEGKPLLAASIMRAPLKSTPGDERLRILVLGNIHSGECAGKEAMLMLLRELAADHSHHWLDGTVLVFVPNYNADGNDNMDRNNRRGQLGPENGMGRRENAQGYDLNRDFMKLDSPEARALVKLIDDVNPHLFIDCHTTNGSRHRYALTYDIPHNPSCAEPIREYLRDAMMPRITNTLQKDGTATFYYGNFNPEHTTWTTYGHEPRYSTEYVGLRGRLAILSEAYSYISYQDRIMATKAFVTACIDDAQQNAAAVRQVLENAEQPLVDTASRANAPIRISLDAKVAPLEERVLLAGYKNNQPHDYDCQFFGRFESTKLTDLPAAYLIPKTHAQIVEHLKRHGIDVTQTTDEQTLSVEVDRIQSVEEADRPFQQHRMLRAVSQRRTERRAIPAGTFRVDTTQPLGRLAACLLEPDSNDGLVVWNFFPKSDLADQDYPIVRLVTSGDTK